MDNQSMRAGLMLRAVITGLLLVLAAGAIFGCEQQRVEQQLAEARDVLTELQEAAGQIDQWLADLQQQLAAAADAQAAFESRAAEAGDLIDAAAAEQQRAELAAMHQQIAGSISALQADRDRLAAAMATQTEHVDLLVTEADAAAERDEAWLELGDTGAAIAGAFGGAGAVVAGGWGFVRRLIARKASDGRVDGAATMVDGIAVLRGLSPELDRAFQNLTPGQQAAMDKAIATVPEAVAVLATKRTGGKLTTAPKT